MNKIFLICAVFATAFASCTKECEDPETGCVTDLSKGLIAYYPFNGNANDESGNGNNGTAVTGAFFTTDLIGRPNKAAGFDGVNDYFIVNDNGKLNSSEVTVSFMVYFNSINRSHTFVNRVNFTNASASIWGVGQSFAHTNNFDFAVAPSSGDCVTPYAYNADHLVSVSDVMQPNRWYHVLASFGNGEQKLFVNGEFKASKKRDFTSLKNCTAANLLIGGWWSGGIISIDGKIDEVRIYNRALNECEIDDITSIFK